MTNYSRSVLLSNSYKHPEIRLKKFNFSLKTTFANIVKELSAHSLLKSVFFHIFDFAYKCLTLVFAHESGYTLGFPIKIAHSGLHAEIQGFTLVIAWRFISHLTFGQAKAVGSGCTPVACVRFIRHRSPAVSQIFMSIYMIWTCLTYK